MSTRLLVLICRLTWIFKCIHTFLSLDCLQCECSLPGTLSLFCVLSYYNKPVISSGSGCLRAFQLADEGYD